MTQGHNFAFCTGVMTSPPLFEWQLILAQEVHYCHKLFHQKMNQKTRTCRQTLSLSIVGRQVTDGDSVF